MAGCGYYDDYDGCYGEYEGDCPDTVNATLSIDGDTATLEWSLDGELDFSDFMDDDTEDCSYSVTQEDCDECGGDWDEMDNYCYSDGEEMELDIDISSSVTQTIVLEKVE
jgi:hypothetical protein